MKSSSQFNTYLHGSEHAYMLSLSDNIALRNHAKLNSFLFTSFIGGCESIRDIRQACKMHSDAIECSFVESLFAFHKLQRSISNNWHNDFPTVFIDISTVKSAKLLPEIFELNNSSTISLRLIPLFNRRSLAKNIFSLSSDSFDLDIYEKEVNYFIDTTISRSPCPYGVVGGVTAQSLELLLSSLQYKPSFIRLGLFTVECTANFDLFWPYVYKLQHREALLLKSITSTLTTKSSLISKRHNHLVSYLLKSCL